MFGEIIPNKTVHEIVSMNNLTKQIYPSLKDFLPINTADVFPISLHKPIGITLST
jgi:hypothetical protein